MVSETLQTRVGGAGFRKRGVKLLRLLFGFFFGIVLPLAILAAGAAAAIHLMKSGPEARRRPPQRNVRLVETTEAKSSTHRVVVQAMGTVKPVRSIGLQPRVGGQVVEVSDEFTPGGVFAAGETILKIDSRDYDLLVRQREASVAQAESALKIEQGQQSIARREFEIMRETVTDADRDWVLRVPQLASAQATLDAAKAALAQARLDAKRTTVQAPFNAIVQTRNADMGMQVGASTPLGTLLGTDEYWIEVAVRVDELRWIAVPWSVGEEGSPVKVYHEAAWGEGVFREGRVVRLLSELEPDGLMARLLVSVPDPMGLSDEHRQAPRLLIGSYVRVDIEGRELEGVFALDRAMLHGGNQVWALGADGRLDIRTVTVPYSGRQRVYVSKGLSEGDQLVTTNLSAPVEGMALRTASDSPSAAEVGPQNGPPASAPGAQSTGGAAREPAAAREGGPRP